MKSTLDNNKHNLQYFESFSMRELHNDMVAWQTKYCQRLLSINIQKDGDMFCCIALTNPVEVVITNREVSDFVGVSHGCLQVE